MPVLAQVLESLTWAIQVVRWLQNAESDQVAEGVFAGENIEAGMSTCTLTHVNVHVNTCEHVC